jgi:hypothetical protein
MCFLMTLGMSSCRWNDADDLGWGGDYDADGFQDSHNDPGEEDTNNAADGCQDDKRDPSQRVGAQDHGGNVRWAGVRQLTEEFQDLVSF